MALRRPVPLNAICSRKCATPPSSGMLVAGASLYPDAQGNRLQMRHHIRQDVNAVAKA